VVIIDQVTKIWAESSLSFYNATVLIPKVLELQLVHNYGAAYGILQHHRWLLIAISVAVVGGCLLFKNQLITSKLSHAGILFLVMGASGNLMDRVSRTYVVDFINIHLFPIFNLADVWIDVGICFLILEFFTSYGEIQNNGK